ncbi:hypothetical protein B7463_g7197, partial [Scytalidium lignicola]
MKRNTRSGKDQGKASGKKNSSQPVLRGPGTAKNSTPSAKSKAVREQNRSLSNPDHVISVKLEQLLLNIFLDTFADILSSNSLKTTLQEVKSALFDRDFTRAFGKDEYLEAYSIRWSPSRALCYTSILVQLQGHLEPLFQAHSQETAADVASGNNELPSRESLQRTLDVVCIGGGAAEMVACGGLLWSLWHGSSTPALPTTSAKDENSITESLTDLQISDGLSTLKNANFSATLIDVAQWGAIVQRLQEGLITPPPLSKYASTAAKEANSALIHPEQLKTRFYAKDVLDFKEAELRDLIGQRPTFLTLLFTLNELYTASIGKTTKLLLDITSYMKPGSLLLVVDSPGSYSETTVGVESKKVPDEVAHGSYITGYVEPRKQPNVGQGCV